MGNSVAIFQRTLAVIAVALFLGAAGPSAAHAEDLQDHGSIRAAVVAAVQAELGQPGARVVAEADEIDRRLRLARCETPLAVTLPPGRRASRRVTAEVQCQGGRAWKIFVPARVTVYQRVVVAARALARGSVLAESDIKMAEQDTSSLPYGYLLQPEHAIGNRVRRDINAGTPVTPAMLETPALVKRGQQVTLEARSGGMVVRTAGIAKTDGVRGEVISVENASSKRIVHAIVRSGKTVEVLLN